MNLLIKRIIDLGQETKDNAEDENTVKRSKSSPMPPRKTKDTSRSGQVSFEHYRSSPVVSRRQFQHQESNNSNNDDDEEVERLRIPRKNTEFFPPKKEVLNESIGMRPRGKTMPSISMSRKRAIEEELEKRNEPVCKGYVNPYFVFLQFFYSPYAGCAAGTGDKPIILESSEVNVYIIKSSFHRISD